MVLSQKLKWACPLPPGTDLYFVNTYWAFSHEPARYFAMTLHTSRHYTDISTELIIIVVKGCDPVDEISAPTRHRVKASDLTPYDIGPVSCENAHYC